MRCSSAKRAAGYPQEGARTLVSFVYRAGKTTRKIEGEIINPEDIKEKTIHVALLPDKNIRVFRQSMMRNFKYKLMNN